jgi:serine/threonine kinase PknH
MYTQTNTPPPGTGPQQFMGPPPVGPYAAGPYPNGGGGKPRKSRTRWLIAGGVGGAALLVIVLAALAGGRNSSSQSESPKAVPTVAPERIESVLLTASQINTIMGASSMQPGKLGEFPAKPSTRLSMPECNGALYPGETPTYDGSGYTKLNYLVSTEPGDTSNHFVDQDVATFPSADLARNFVKTSVSQWKSCASQVVSVTNDNGNTFRWSFGDVTGDAPKISQSTTQEDGRGWACQHVLSAVSNVVIDVRACSYGVTDQASRIADEIAANATR